MRYWNDNTINNYFRKVDMSGGPNACWPWTGSVTPAGYGHFTWSINGTRGAQSAHRIGYEFLVGDIPDGLHIDHLCHDPRECDLNERCPHRRCQNPDHLKAVTPKENVYRAGRGAVTRWIGVTECQRGHPFGGHNLIITARGTRACRTCQNAAVHRYQERKKIELALKEN